MSDAKVIFTYKRKRLSSCSSRAHADVYNDLLDGAKAGKYPDLMKEYTSQNKKGDPGDNLLNCKSCCQSYHPKCLEACNNLLCCGKQLSQLPDQTNQPISQAKKQVEGSTSKITHKTHMLPPSNVSFTETSNILNEDARIVLPLENIECCIHKNASSQLAEQDKSKLLRFDNFVKPKLTSPLITFSRRNKRKADGVKTDVLNKLLSERETVESKHICVSTCDPGGNVGTSANQFDHQKPASDASDASLMPCETEGRVAGELGDWLPCNPSKTCSATAAPKQLDQTTCAEDLNLISLSSAEHVLPKIQESNIFAPSKEAGTRNALQDSSSPVLVSSNSKTCPGGPGPPASTGGILPITSSNGSEIKDLPRVKEEQTDACVTDCNMALERESPEQAVLKAVENRQLSSLTTGNNIVMRDESRRGEGLDLYMFDGQRNGLCQMSGDNSHFPKHPSKFIHLDGSRLEYDSESANHVPVIEKAPKRKYLQLFSEDSTCTYLASSQHETIGSNWERGRTFASEAEKHRLEQFSVRAPLSFGVSAQSFGGQSSTQCSLHPFTSLSIRTGDYFHTDGGHSLRDHAEILRHKMMLDSVNSRATSMRGIGSSMDMFELCPNVWTEDELDFLWIGVRRHGRGNWDVMLRDPRLHFSPLRMPRDLAERWELEQYKLLNESGGSQGRYAKPTASYGYLDCNDPFLSSRPGLLRDCAMAETQLSLGDVYRQKEAGFYNYNAQRHNRTRKTHRLGRASSKRLSSSIKLRINNHNLHGESNPHSVTVPSMDASVERGTPHWLHDAANSSKLPAASISLAGTSSFMTGEASTSAHHGDRFVLGEMVPCPGNSSKNLIVIDSDVSSEETISDEQKC